MKKFLVEISDAGVKELRRSGIQVVDVCLVADLLMCGARAQLDIDEDVIKESITVTEEHEGNT